MRDTAPLNLAGRLAQAFITSKLTIVFIVAVSLAGALAVLLTPREENPQIVVPGAKIAVALPGASAAEVEELVVRPLESILSELNGVDHTFGVAQNSVGVVQVQFKVGESKEASLVKLYDRIAASRNRFPADAQLPLVQSIDADDVPVLAVTLASNRYDDYALKRMADHMAERLRSIENVSVVSVRGGRDREFGIQIDPLRLQAFGISLSQARAAFDASNLSVPLQPTVRAGQTQAITLRSWLSSTEELRRVIVGVHDGRPIYLGDVAEVTDGPPTELDHFSRFSYGAGDARGATPLGQDMPAVSLAVAKKKGANAVVVANAVRERIERLQASTLPQDVAVVVTRDDGQKADDAVNGLIEHLAIALITVGFIMIFFLGWREALIVMVTVPLIFALTLVSDLLAGITINRVTLFALILALGLLVDAAIVVIENIHRHYRASAPGGKLDTTVLATNEIGNATNLATLAVMLVFSALFLVTGMPGDYFYPIAFNVPVAMAASVLVAYIVTPWAANRWVSRHGHGDGSPAATFALATGDAAGQVPATERKLQRDRLQALYLRLFEPLQHQRRARLRLAVGVCILLTLSIMQGAWQFVRPSGAGGAQSPLGVALGFLPKDNKNTFNIVVSMAETTPVEQTDRFVREIAVLLSANPHVANYQSWIGAAGVPDFNGLFQGTTDHRGSAVAEIRVNLVDKQARKASSIDIVRALRPAVERIRAEYPGARVRLVEDPPGPPLRATVLAEIYGPEAEGLHTLATQVEQEFAATYDLVDISNSEPSDILERRLVPDREKAALSGVSVAQIAEVLRLVYGGEVLGRAHPPNEKHIVDIRAYVPRHYEVDPAGLRGLYVGNAAGQSLPLSELVRSVSTATDRPIFRKDNERVAFVGAEMGATAPLYAVLDLNRRLEGMRAPDGRPLTTGNLSLRRQAPDVIDGYRILWDGEMRMTLDVYRDMGVALGGALLLVYLLLVAYYGSFAIPLIAMSAVPLGVIGIFPGHWLVGADFSATSMVGIIALSGVVIRNSLLIIDFIQDHLRRGLPVPEAVRNATALRLRPILLTTLAIVLGSAVMVSDPVFGGLAISLIFGTLASTALTVFVVPILFQLFVQHHQRRATTSHLSGGSGHGAEQEAQSND